MKGQATSAQLKPTERNNKQRQTIGQELKSSRPDLQNEAGSFQEKASYLVLCRLSPHSSISALLKDVATL